MSSVIDKCCCSVIRLNQVRDYNIQSLINRFPPPNLAVIYISRMMGLENSQQTHLPCLLNGIFLPSSLLLFGVLCGSPLLASLTTYVISLYFCHFALALVLIFLLLSYVGFLNCSQLKYKIGGNGCYACLTPLLRPVSLQHRISVQFRLSVHIVWKYFKLQEMGPALIHQHMKERKTIHTTESMKT